MNPNWKFPSKVKGTEKDMMALLLEAERRVAPKSPFYMAKYIMGRGNRRKGKLWGWNRNHVEASHLLAWAYRTREDRSSGTIVYFEWTRGSRKSTMLQASAVCFMQDDPNETMLWDGDVSKKAADKIYMVKEVFEDPYFQRLFGDLRGVKWTKDQLVLKRNVRASDPTLKVSGLDSSKTGGHHGIIYFDDVQTDDNADSPQMNEDVKTNFRLYTTLHQGKACPLTLGSGTRWGFRDLGYMIQEMQDEEKRRKLKPTIFISRIACYKRGKKGWNKKAAEFPEGGLDIDSLRRVQMTTRPMLFSFNYLLEPYSAEDAPFKKEYIRYHNLTLTSPELADAEYWLIVDPAGEGKFRGADFNAMTVIAVTPEAEMFVMEIVNKHLTKMGLFEEILRMNHHYPQLRVMVETYFQQHALYAWLKNKATELLVNVNWVKFKQDYRKKDIRISSLEHYFM